MNPFPTASICIMCTRGRQYSIVLGQADAPERCEAKQLTTSRPNANIRIILHASSLHMRVSFQTIFQSPDSLSFSVSESKKKRVYHLAALGMQSRIHTHDSSH